MAIVEMGGIVPEVKLLLKHGVRGLERYANYCGEAWDRLQGGLHQVH